MQWRTSFFSILIDTTARRKFLLRQLNKVKTCSRKRKLYVLISGWPPSGRVTLFKIISNHFSHRFIPQTHRSSYIKTFL